MRCAFRLLPVLLLAVPLAAAQGPLNPTPHTVVCFLDVDADGSAGHDEPVYLQILACGGGVSAGDARLSPFAGFPAGTLVNGSHDDVSRPTVPWGAGYGFLDENGDGSYSAGELLVLHAGPLPGALAPGDLLLSGSPPFQRLAGDDGHVGDPVLAASVAVGGESYAERDGISGYTTGDFILLDLDGNGLTTLGDLRLAVPAPAPSQSTSATSPASTTSTPHPPPSDTSSASLPPTSAPASTSEPQAGVGPPQAIPAVPGGPALLVLALCAFLRRLH